MQATPAISINYGFVSSGNMEILCRCIGGYFGDLRPRLMGSRGLMDRALDLKPAVTQGCGFESRLWQEVSTTEVSRLWQEVSTTEVSRLWQEVSTTEVRPLSKAPNPQLLPGHRSVSCPLLHLDGLNAENTFHCSLYSV